MAAAGPSYEFDPVGSRRPRNPAPEFTENEVNSGRLTGATRLTASAKELIHALGFFRLSSRTFSPDDLSAPVADEDLPLAAHQVDPEETAHLLARRRSSRGDP